MQNEPVEVTLKVTEVLEKLGIPYLIGGSLASTLYGMVRTTQDSDIIAEMVSRTQNRRPAGTGIKGSGIRLCRMSVPAHNTMVSPTWDFLKKQCSVLFQYQKIL